MLKPADFRLYLGTLSLNFAATYRRLPGWELERIPSGADLARWFAATGLAAPGAAVSDEEHAAALGLREAIYRIGRALVDGRPPAANDVATLNAAAALPPPVPVLDAGTLEETTLAAAPVQAAFARIAADAVHLFGSAPERARLRKCEACDQLMLSAARGRARRWCSMQTCGNRAKVAAFRERTKQ